MTEDNTSPIHLVVFSGDQSVIDIIRGFTEIAPEFTLVASANSSDDCVRIVGDTQADVVVIDISIGLDHSIEDAVKILKAHPHVKVFGSSTSSPLDWMRQGLQIGMKDFLSKPLDFDEFSITIRHFVSIDKS